MELLEFGRFFRLGAAMEKCHGFMRRLACTGMAGLVGLLTWNGYPAFSQEPAANRRPVDLAAGVIVRCKAATALVDLQSMGSGSAVCVSADGFFVTNYHVVMGVGLGSNIKLVLNPGQKSERVLEARVVKLEKENDLALLKVDGARDLAALSLGSDDGLFETMPITAFGYPFGRMLSADNGYPSVSVNTGAATALRRKRGELESIQLDASVNPGNSGGPVVDQKGNVIGIVVSGLPGARVNFAIPVRRVRQFLAGPALVLRKPRIVFLERDKPRRFEIDAYAFDRRALDNLIVELVLAESADHSRTLVATRAGDQFVAEGSLNAPETTALKWSLVIQKGRARITSELPAGEVSFGGRKFAWMAIDSLVKDGDEWIVSMLSGERFASKTVGLPSVSVGTGRTTQLATADRIEVRVENAPPADLSYEVQSHQGETVFASVRGQLPIENRPKGMKPSLGQPMARTDVREPIVVEVLVRENLEIGVLPGGLVVLPQKGQPAGMEDERGRYVLVNGQPWHLDLGVQQQPFMNGQAMPMLPIFLGMRDCQIRILWARPEVGGAHNGDRIATSERKIAQMGLTSVAIANRAKEPTRIAVGITFEPARSIVPLLPARSGPVLESHWPLNDADPTRAVDMGPGNHTGLMSSAHVVPGVRGHGIQINRQPVFCPGVLPIERTDSFSCSAWIRPNPATGMTIFSRMSRDLRGFDLSYSNRLEAHLISSWDGNAIKVSTVERFDSSEWHHVVLTYDGSSLARGVKIYLDGALATLAVELDRLSESIKCDAPFAIGCREGRDYYQGRIDEVRTYDRELSADEIVELFDLERSNIDPAAGSSLNEGLVGFWSFDGSPGEWLKDRSKGRHDGRVEPDSKAPRIVRDGGGGAIRLDGTQALACGPITDFERTDRYSLGAWFKPRGDGDRVLLGTLDTSDRGFQVSFDGRIRCAFIAQWDGSAIEIVTKTTYPNDVWHHVVVTYDGSSRSSGYQVFVDGLEATFDVLHDSLTSSTKNGGRLRIGGRITMHYYAGDLDDIFVYRRTIAPDEAKAWFAGGRSSALALSVERRRGLVGLWSFDGEGPETFRDRSGNKHDCQPDWALAHSAIVPEGRARVARILEVGGIDCGQAGDFDRTDAFSAGGWFRSDSRAHQTLLGKIQYGSINRGYDLQYDGETYLAQITHNWEEPPVNAIAIQTGPMPGTGWRHVLFTYDGSSLAKGLKIYVNGELQKASVVKDTLSKSIRVREPFVIGSRQTGLTMRGAAAQVRLIPRELSAVEVRQLAKADQPPGALP